MRITTPAYSANGTPLPPHTYEASANFVCNFGPDQHFPVHIVMGFWVRDASIGAVTPIYLSQEQLSELLSDEASSHPSEPQSDFRS